MVGKECYETAAVGRKCSLPRRDGIRFQCTGLPAIARCRLILYIAVSSAGSLVPPAGFVHPTLPFEESSCSLQGVLRLTDGRCSRTATPRAADKSRVVRPSHRREASALGAAGKVEGGAGVMMFVSCNHSSQLSY